MAATPTFSVVVPSYNYARFLPLTLDSVLTQGRDDVEIIVVDDASTDETPQVVSRYVAAGQIDYIRLSSNVGPGRAWAMGLERATGAYVCKLDADDWQLGNWMDVMEGVFESDPAVGMAVGSAFVFDDNGKDAYVESVTDADCTLDPTAFRTRLLRDFFFRMPSVCLRRSSTFGHAPPREDLRLPHDWEYFLRVTKGWKVRLFTEPVAVYRVHGESLTLTSEFGERLARDYRVFFDAVGDPSDPAYLDSVERRVFASGAARSYLGVIGPRLSLWELRRAALELRHALAMSAAGGPRAVFETLQYAGWGAARRIRHRTLGSSDSLRVDVEQLLPEDEAGLQGAEERET